MRREYPIRHESPTHHCIAAWVHIRWYEMAKKSFVALGLDFGTESVRALLVDGTRQGTRFGRGPLPSRPDYRNAADFAQALPPHLCAAGSAGLAG